MQVMYCINIRALPRICKGSSVSLFLSHSRACRGAAGYRAAVESAAQYPVHDGAAGTVTPLLLPALTSLQVRMTGFLAPLGVHYTLHGVYGPGSTMCGVILCTGVFLLSASPTTLCTLEQQGRSRSCRYRGHPASCVRADARVGSGSAVFIYWGPAAP